MDLGGSFTTVPKRTTDRFEPPPHFSSRETDSHPHSPLQRGFSLFWREHPPLPSMFLHSDSHAHSSTPHTGDLLPASKDRISLLWLNGNPTTWEFQTLPQSTPISIGSTSPILSWSGRICMESSSRERPA
ncbi:hypothetical protein AVEN_134097-1 [Araneus ventricosus]|uniref:Uncharacterized protein n=1 Tax=Araneus ventricosus TaxID=182803 RepID=A0A4Y2U5R1_ARAVE|nr:hypothetical protein AVEN_134097-1 [Araneus ventricosus]